MTSDLFANAPDPLAERDAIVALSMVPGVGPGRLRSLVARFGSAVEALTAPPQALEQVSGIGSQTAKAIHSFDDTDAVRAQVERAERVGAELLLGWDPRFPSLLREIYDPPAALWVRGQLPPPDLPLVAIVGSRKCTDYGRHIAHDFAEELAQRGYVIVSGLAYGIDAAAHQGAIAGGGWTIGVLGSGVDVIYPSRHAELARRMMEQGGVVSEFPLGAAPDAPNFPRRNRIISGMSQGLLVVESGPKGGSLISARLAVEQNREVFAIPSPVHSRAGIGTNRLIQDGHAKLVLSVGDMLEEFGDLSIDPDGQATSATAMPAAHSHEPDLSELSDVERRLYEALEPTPQHIDRICERAELDASDALVYLLNLEFSGYVRQMAGKQFMRT